MLWKNTTTVSTSKAEKGVGKWLTNEQLASPLYFNSQKHADVRCKNMPEQPHEDPDLAKDGVMQYWHVDKAVDTSKEEKQTAEVTCKAEMTAEQYEQVKAGMESALSSAPTDRNNSAESAAKRSRKKKLQLADNQKAAETEQEKTTRLMVEAMKAAKTKLEKTLAECKKSVDRINTELGTVELLKKTMASKPWDASQMISYLEEQTQLQRVASEGMNTSWADAKLKLATSTIEEKEKLGKALEAKMTEANTAYNLYVKNVVGEYAKFKRVQIS